MSCKKETVTHFKESLTHLCSYMHTPTRTRLAAVKSRMPNRVFF